MPQISILFGGVLIAVGVWGYTAAPPEKQSLTALIPAFEGGLLLLLGLLALKESLLKHAMHGAAMVGLLGFLGGVANLIRVAAKGGDLTSLSGVSTQFMTVFSAVFVGLCVNSFIQVRRRRRAAAAQAQTQR